MSNPPNIGEPRKNAIVTAIPNPIPTAMKRLFIGPVLTSRDKNELIEAHNLE